MRSAGKILLMSLCTLTLLLGTSALHPQHKTADLKVIMNQLMMDMFTVNQGIWQEDFSLIAQGANDIVHHPKIPRGQKQRISEILGNDMARFARYDKQVHNHADSLKQAAKEHSMDRVLKEYRTVQNGCVGCHTAFREPLQNAGYTQ